MTFENRNIGDHRGSSPMIGKVNMFDFPDGSRRTIALKTIDVQDLLLLMLLFVNGGKEHGVYEPAIEHKLARTYGGK